jgi:LPS export ABC transporter permease LptG/LPS export ABC transporter permease LptF
VAFLQRLRPTLFDRYVSREIGPPTGVGLLLFTFILLLDQIANHLKVLIAGGADLGTVVRAFAYLLPSIFSVTIPMAFLLGVLLAFGRMASDSEIVALRATGVSPLSLLRPVMALAVVAASVTFYVYAILGPAANQAYREIVFALLVSKARNNITPRVFNDDLIPGGSMVLYVSDISAESGQWKDVFIHDTRNPQQPKAILARTGRLVIDKERKSVGLDLEDAVWYTFHPSEPRELDSSRGATAYFPFAYEEFFPRLPLARGDRELTMGELAAKVQELKAAGKGRIDWGRYLVEWHKKLAIPTACVVFGLLGLGLSLGSKKEARSAAFGLSIAVIFVYYVLIRLGEQAGDNDKLAPVVGIWGANVILGGVAILLLVLNQREAAFDPLDFKHYRSLLPRIRQARRADDEAAGGPSGPPGSVRRRASGRRPRRIIVLKIPRIELPIPGLLDRYIARTYLGKYGLVLTAFLALFVLVEFMDLFDDIQQNRVKGIVVFHYYLFRMPFLVHLLTPVAVLVTVLITFGVMARYNEITAMKAAGVSIYRVVLPALALSMVVSFLMFQAAEYVLPPTARVWTRDFNEIKGRPRQAITIDQHRWVLGSDGRLYNFDYISQGDETAPPTLYGLSVYDVDPAKWELRRRLYASRAVWKGVWYDLEQLWHWTFLPTGARFEQVSGMRIRDLEKPSYFIQERRESDSLSFLELQKHIGGLEKLGLDVTQLRVELHRKVSYPVVSVIMTLIGVPFAFVVARKGALYGVALSILIAIVYWATLAIFEALGNNAVLPPILASWAPNLIFGTAGLYLLLTLET